MQGTLTCIFAPSVIIVPALSGLACAQAVHSLFSFLIFLSHSPNGPVLVADAYLFPVMILITFSVDLGRLPDMTTMTTLFEFRYWSPLRSIHIPSISSLLETKVHIQ